jgi:PAS domain-containing protein
VIHNPLMYPYLTKLKGRADSKPLKSFPQTDPVCTHSIILINIHVIYTMEDLYKVAIDTSTIFSETDTAGTILNVNDGYCKASGYSRYELAYRPESPSCQIPTPPLYFLRRHLDLHRQAISLEGPDMQQEKRGFAVLDFLHNNSYIGARSVSLP